MSNIFSIFYLIVLGLFNDDFSNSKPHIVE